MDRLEEPPFVSLEDRAGGPFTGGAGDPGDGRGGCGCSGAGCFAGVAVVVVASAALLVLLSAGRPSRPAPEARTEAAPEAERLARTPATPGRASLDASTRARRAAEARPEPRPQPRAEAAPRGPSTPLEAARFLERKLTRVRAITLPVVARASDGRLRYLGWCDEALGPTGKEALHYGPYTLNAIERMAQDLAAEVASAPALPSLDGALRRFAQAAQACAAVLEEADAYYDEERWQTDGFAGGRALHPRLLEAWRALAEANLIVEAERQALLADAEATILSAIADDPRRTSEVRVRRAFAAARAIDDAMRLPLRGPGEEAPERIAALKELGASLYVAVDALGDALPAGAAPVVGAQALETAARELAHAAKALALRYEARSAFTAEERRTLRGQGAPSVSGGAPRVAGRYAQVEAAWLRLRFE